MTTPTNWPNPERIGATCSPPENTKSETWHWLDCGYLTPFAWRDHEGGAWWSNDGEDHLFSPQQMAQLGWRYVGTSAHRLINTVATIIRNLGAAS